MLLNNGAHSSCPLLTVATKVDVDSLECLDCLDTENLTVSTHPRQHVWGNYWAVESK